MYFPIRSWEKNRIFSTERYDCWALDWQSDTASFSDDAVCMSRTRRGVSSTSLCMLPNDLLLLCCWTCKLRKVWIMLFTGMSRLPLTILDQFWKESVFCAIEKVYGMVFGLIWLKPPAWNLAKVRMELLERQQSQERCKSGPKVNTRTVKYSNLSIPSEKFMKLQWQPIKKKRMGGWKQIL